MQRAPTARAGLIVDVDVEPNILARQMVGQGLASRRRLRSFFGDRLLPFLDLGNVAINIFQPKRQLVGIDALGTTSKLHALELFDDRLKALDLAVPMLDCGDNVVH